MSPKSTPVIIFVILCQPGIEGVYPTGILTLYTRTLQLVNGGFQL